MQKTILFVILFKHLFYSTCTLCRYLKNPYNYDGVDELSKKLSEVRVVVQSPAQ